MILNKKFIFKKSEHFFLFFPKLGFSARCFGVFYVTSLIGLCRLFKLGACSTVIKLKCKVRENEQEYNLKRNSHIYQGRWKERFHKRNRERDGYTRVSNSQNPKDGRERSAVYSIRCFRGCKSIRTMKKPLDLMWFMVNCKKS